MWSFNRYSGLTRKILSFVLTMTMTLSLMQFQVTAEALKNDIIIPDEMQRQESAEETDTNTIIVKNEEQFKAALANAQYTTIYLGADIMMLSSNNNIVVARAVPLVINGTDPGEGGTRHTYTDYNGSLTTQALGGACTDITFKDIDIYLNNYYGIYYPRNTAGTTVTLDNAVGSARRFFYGRGANSTLVVKDSELYLDNTGLGFSQDFARNTEAVNFAGTVKAVRNDSSSSFFFNMTAPSTVKIEEGANVVLDNSINKSGSIFNNVTNFIADATATFACYSGQAFCTTSMVSTLSNVTIGEKADVRFIHTGGKHQYNSFYGIDSTSSFTAGPGSRFLLYDDETDRSWGAFWFANITLNDVESFVVLNASNHAIGDRPNPNNLTVNGTSSIRYYPSGQISNLFDIGTHTYTPTRDPDRWWANISPFAVTADGWASAARPTLTDNTYSSANMPISMAVVQTALTSGNFRPYSATAYGIEIYRTICTVTYDGNGANSGTIPVSDAGVPTDLITIKGNTGNLTRSGDGFVGWNTAADGSGTAYRPGNTFRITEDTKLYAQWEPSKYTVTEKHVDELTGRSFGQSDTYAGGISIPYNYSYDGLPEDITVGNDTYTYIGYRAGAYSPGDVLAGSGAPEVSGLTADEVVYLIYHKTTSTIDVTFPVGSSWEFYVNQDTYPNVETGSMGSSNKYYEFKNNSDKPVHVNLTEVQVIASDGLSLVADASRSTPGSSEYSLNLSPASASILPPGSPNGFSENTVTDITEDLFEAGTKQLGSLDGQYIKQSTPTAANGYITIGGYYAGELSPTAKKPQLMFNFTFSLIP